MTLLPGVEQLDCAQLEAELATRRRYADVFAKYIGVVQERASQLSREIAAAEASRLQRIDEREAATRRRDIDKAALDACLGGIDQVGGECTAQENFLENSERRLREANAALSAVETSLHSLQARASELNLELVSLSADRQALEGDVDQIQMIMDRKGCPIAA